MSTVQASNGTALALPYSFLLEAESTSSHGAAGRFISIKKSSDTIGIRTRDLPTCSAVRCDNVKRNYGKISYNVNGSG